jgi:type II secretory pathway component PulF
MLSGDRIPPHEVGLLFERLAALLACGMLVQEVLREAARSSAPELQSICERAAERATAGVPLYQALTPWKHRLPEIVTPVLEVGQVSGTLESSARRLAHAFSRVDAFERRFRYSVSDRRLFVAVLFLYTATSAPAFLTADEPGQALLRLLVSAIHAVLALIAFFVSARLILRWLFRGVPLRLWAHTIKLALPHMGIVARDLSAARGARSFPTLRHAGVPISYALEASSRSALNAHFEIELLRAARETRQGRSLSDSLATTQLLPAHLVSVLRTGETTGNFEPPLDRLATMLEHEALTMGTQELGTIVVAVKIFAAVAMFAALRRS